VNPVPDSIEASKKVLEGASGRILRICWEMNGSMATTLLEEMVSLSLSSGDALNSARERGNEGQPRFGVMEKRKQ
jgi:hypothetical protein